MSFLVSVNLIWWKFWQKWKWTSCWFKTKFRFRCVQVSGKMVCFYLLFILSAMLLQVFLKSFSPFYLMQQKRIGIILSFARTVLLHLVHSLALERHESWRTVLVPSNWNTDGSYEKLKISKYQSADLPISTPEFSNYTSRVLLGMLHFSNSSMQPEGDKSSVKYWSLSRTYLSKKVWHFSEVVFFTSNEFF